MKKPENTPPFYPSKFAAYGISWVLTITLFFVTLFKLMPTTANTPSEIFESIFLAAVVSAFLGSSLLSWTKHSNLKETP